MLNFKQLNNLIESQQKKDPLFSSLVDKELIFHLKKQRRILDRLKVNDPEYATVLTYIFAIEKELRNRNLFEE
jgi:hypothetical protein